MRVGGLASGMDTDSIVKQMMMVQKMPLDKLMQKKVFMEWQQQAMRDTNLSLSNLRSSASNMRLQSTFNAYSATSSNSASLTATASATAMAGTYDVEVLSIASPAKMTSQHAITKVDNGQPAKSTDQIGVAGTVTVSGVTIDIAANLTYAQVAKKIQDETAGQTPELRVNFDNTTSRFFMTSKELGADQAFNMEFSNVELANQIANNGTDIAASSGATDASIKFNGIEINGLKTNRTTVNGLTLDLLQAGTTTTVTVKSDPAKPMETIKKFVEQYNETISEIEKQLIQRRYPDFQPLSDDQKKDMSEKEVELWEEKARSGLLRNDPVLRKAVQELRSAFMGEVQGLPDGSLKLLSQIGINTGSYTEGGKLFIEEAKLTAALSNKPDEVMALFTHRSDAGNGIGVQVYDKLNDIVRNLSAQAGSPTSSVDNSTISKKLRQMDSEITRWQDRLSKIEDRYWKQFTAMEKALSQMNSQSMWMQQNMFGGM